MFYNCAVFDIAVLNPIIFIIVSGGGWGCLFICLFVFCYEPCKPLFFSKGRMMYCPVVALTKVS